MGKYQVDVIITISTTITVDADNLQMAEDTAKEIATKNVFVDSNVLRQPTFDVDVEIL